MDQHYFIAIPIVDETLTRFAAELELDRYYKTVYEPSEYHLTLRFLGNVSNLELVRWRQHLSEIVQTISPFTLQVDHLERFGLAQRPRVFAVGLQRERTLVRLADQIDPAPSKPFVPHITLAKKWDQEVFLLPPEHSPSFNVSVKEIVLYKISPADRPRYQVDTRFQIGKKTMR